MLLSNDSVLRYDEICSKRNAPTKYESLVALFQKYISL
jgi:hypothetical protein